MPQGVPETNFSARWEGYLVPDESGIHKISFTADDGVRFWFDNKLVINEWQAQNSTFYFSESLKKGKSYPIKIEYFQGAGNAMARLGWYPPEYLRNQKPLAKTDSVYLPQNTDGWYDFRTNEFYTGGQTICKNYPIDIFPLFVKAGSILPLGPVVQYADEKTNAPLEIRIYSGANGTFTFYEDEGDNYNYEEGKYNTIDLHWANNKKILIIGESTGNFKGFNKGKIIKIVLIQPSLNRKDKTTSTEKRVVYKGKPVAVTF